MLINTYFNIRSERIVNTQEDASRCCMGTHMDMLTIENFVLYKKEFFVDSIHFSVKGMSFFSEELSKKNRQII